MKTRKGFVSNSSSSSFVIGLPKKPKNKFVLMDILYPVDKKTGNRRGVNGPYGEDNVDADTAANLVWEQIKDQKPLTKTQIRNEISTGWFKGRPDYPFNDSEPRKIADECKRVTGKNVHDDDADPSWKKRYDDAFEAQSKAWSEAVEKAANEYFEKEYELRLKGNKCFRCSFSDNDGSMGCTMEHGDTFYNVPHIQISHH